ncbi:hypothetical protein [Pseudoteredinibacter isoporae]|uniref:Cobalt transporter n=1 Tax=Pseudoteredinibacter isoporae TaxID=570281 RepID=A0A7X0MWF5_9GAMM|nr:hypothetical protein [Pseudoteredinibacter isoporae]MBB6522120.1 hypothetical protein [Pseudoteredinibacter isoporae]NHO87655.1 hypothetical protein [Pseudoteredinibacter isoporae]NIB24014.1 hypothetical protein [Pseudoteredinibacter isoporae]
MALRFLITFMVLSHMLINSIAAFHYVADLDHHAGEGFHLHADEQLFVGISDLVDQHHDQNSNDQEQSAGSCSAPAPLSTDGLFSTVLDLTNEEHDDGSHVHLQLESMLASVQLYSSDSPEIPIQVMPNYLSWAYSPPVPPPTA